MTSRLCANSLDTLRKGKRVRLVALREALQRCFEMVDMKDVNQFTQVGALWECQSMCYKCRKCLDSVVPKERLVFWDEILQYCERMLAYITKVVNDLDPDAEPKETEPKKQRFTTGKPAPEIEPFLGHWDAGHNERVEIQSVGARVIRLISSRVDTLGVLYERTIWIADGEENCTGNIKITDHDMAIFWGPLELKWFRWRI